MGDNTNSSNSSENTSNISTMTDVDTKTLPRIGGSRRDAEIWKFRIESWFNREGITTNDNKFSYIISSAEDDVVRVLKAKEVELNRIPTLDECVEVIKKKYWRENRKDNKLRQFKRLTIEPGETVYDFNTRYWDLYDKLETGDRASISVMDYENALRPRSRIYEKIAMEEYESLEDACSQAEKYENILQESYVHRNIRGRKESTFHNNYNNNSNYPTIDDYEYNYNNPWNYNSRNPKNFKNSSFHTPLNATSRIHHVGSVNHNINNRQHNINNNLGNNYNNSHNVNNHNNNQNNINHDDVDELINKMESLHIKTCYFCRKPGHLIKDCKELTRLQNDPNFLNYLSAQKN